MTQESVVARGRSGAAVTPVMATDWFLAAIAAFSTIHRPTCSHPWPLLVGTYAKTHCCKFWEPLRRLCVCVFVQVRKQLRLSLVLELVASLRLN